HREAVRPDEEAAAETRHHLAVRPELVDRVGLRVAALVAESSRVGQRLTPHDRPDMPAVSIDDGLADRAERLAAGKLRPAINDAIGVRERLPGEDAFPAGQKGKEQGCCTSGSGRE